MKKKIKKTLQMLEPRPMPDKEKILAACPVAPVSEETRKSVIPTGRRFSPVKAVALAMSALLVIGGGIGIGGAVVAEAKEYQEAVDFFEQYNLSAEGFTRSEVKKIYKDIVSESFTYEKTEQALASGLEGYEIQAQPLNPEDLKRVWTVGYKYGVELRDYEDTDQYTYHWQYSSVPGGGGHMPHMTWYKNGEKQWDLYLENFIDPRKIAPIGDKVLIAGVPNGENYNKYMLRICLLNADSTQIWQKDYKCPFPTAYGSYSSYYSEEDTVTLFVRSPYAEDKVWMLTFDLNGNVINEEFVDIDPAILGFGNAVRIGEDYLLSTGDVLLRKTGNKIESLTDFGNDDEQYVFTDMVEFNGLVYLSGKVMPKYHNRQGGDAYDNFVKEYGKDGISDDEVKEFYMNNHTAVLMICDPATGEPQSFYTIPGASGSNLSVKGNQLTWNVHRYTGAGGYNENYYLTTGSLGDITAGAWKYVFSPYGQLVGEKDTGRSVILEGN